MLPAVYINTAGAPHSTTEKKTPRLSCAAAVVNNPQNI